MNTHARRAIANCKPVSSATFVSRSLLIAQPWEFFNVPPPQFSDIKKRRAEREAREAAAAASGHGGVPKRSIHHEPPTLEQSIRELKLDSKGK